MLSSNDVRLDTSTFDFPDRLVDHAVLRRPAQRLVVIARRRLLRARASKRAWKASLR